MAGLGTPAPDFAIPDVISGDTITLETFAADRRREREWVEQVLSEEESDD